ncbi:hypothetical protein [Faecalicatena contorta]|uniref:hypothetical protein n=2 Tax=Lachnospirales TaxID=3085636 RepID=UPI001FB9FE61|nr:hypothetical protein [Faecalicatena contorta]
MKKAEDLRVASDAVDTGEEYLCQKIPAYKGYNCIKKQIETSIDLYLFLCYDNV